MNTFLYRSLCIFIMLLLLRSVSIAQSPPALSVKQLVSAVNDKAAAAEQLYIHTDKPAYNAGDTLWFKTYLLNKASLKASVRSGVLYIELANDSNRIMKRMMLPVYFGVSMGNIVLDAADYPQGGYVLRGYTNWMRNMPEACIFKKHFYVSDSKGDDWLINQYATVSKTADKQNVNLKLRVNQLDRTPVMVREMQLRLTDGRRTWLKSNVQTDLSGLIDVNFNLPEKANAQGLAISLQDMRKGADERKLIAPLILNRPENVDLQFMPEGGKLVAGLPANVAFKAINEDGLGANVQGEVLDSKAQVIASFNTGYKGMGTFVFMPQTGESYNARVKLPNGSYKTYALPVVAASGISLRVRNTINADTCTMTISATSDIIAAGGSYYLLGIARDIVCYGAGLQASKLPISVKIAKNIFPSGVVRFIIADTRYDTTNERLVYIDHKDALKIKVTPNKPSFAQRDSVALDINVTDKDGQPVEGSFSLAITDDVQVKIDSIANASILTTLQLTSILRGTIETPGYYANATVSPVKWQHLDQLLLTQGWVGHDWTEVFKPAKNFVFPAEKEPLITGKVTNMFNKPVAGSGVTLLSKKPMFVTDTVANQQGIFTFKNIPMADTAVYFIQARNKRGKSFNVGIEMDEFKAPKFTALTERTIPWFMDLDSIGMVSIKKQLSLKSEQQRISRGTVLKAVEVKAKKVIKGSKNLNGPGEADIIIDEQALEKVGRSSLGDLLEKNVKGFISTYKKGVRLFAVNFMPVKIIIDGIDVEFAKPEGVSLYDHIKQYLDYYDAEEIKGIEVMTRSGNQSKYDMQYLDPMAQRWEHVYVEVTTRSGAGPFVKKAVGTYVYRPLPYSLPKTFYIPKYKTNTTPDMTDIRATVHWEPNIITNKEGKATVSFYTTDNVGNYTVIIEGADLEGNIGTQSSKIVVKRAL